jgi:hypothetical protein
MLLQPKEATSKTKEKMKNSLQTLFSDQQPGVGGAREEDIKCGMTWKALGNRASSSAIPSLKKAPYLLSLVRRVSYRLLMEALP